MEAGPVNLRALAVYAFYLSLPRKQPGGWERAALEQYDNKLPLEAWCYFERVGARL